jgi:DNA-binding LacI/PurR family transcriptional regulator
MKRQQLVEELKDWIIKGDMKSGDCLPTYEELNNRFDASRATFHHVLNQLKQDGFVVGVERKGTFLAKNLPCHSRFAIVFESDEQDNVFWSKLAREAQQISRRNPKCRFQIFHNDDTQGDMESLQDQLRRRMVAGIFFFFNPDKGVAKTIAQENPSIPKIFCQPYDRASCLCIVRLDAESCVVKVMEEAASQGVGKIGLISRGEQSLIKPFREVAERIGLTTRPEWILSAPEKYIGSVKNLVWLLMSLPNENRPEALYITDDNLLPLVQSALVEVGVKVPDELKLICHFNFPDHSQPVLPVKKVGYDVRDILNKGVEMIRSHNTDSPVKEVVVSGKCDSEIH